MDIFRLRAKFGEKDIITNKIHYDYAISCRENENKCGENGIFFEQDTPLNIYLTKFREPIFYILVFTGSFIVSISFITILEKINIFYN